MLSAILLASLAAPADPIIDRTRPLLSDWDISGTTVSVEITRGPAWYEYVYTFASSPVNRSEVTRFYLDTACDQPVADDLGGLFPGKQGMDFTTPLDMLYYMPVIGMWANGKSGLADVTHAGAAGFWVMIKPGESRTVRLRSTGAPVPRAYSLQPRVEYYGRIDWPEDSDMIEGLPTERDFAVHGVIEGPGCEAVATTHAEFRLDGVGTMREFHGVNTLLTYAHPLRNRLHLEPGRDSIDMVIHYSTDIDPETFATCPAELRHHFNPSPGVTERVSLPIGKARGFVTLAARAQGELPEQPRHDYPTFSPIDVDVFEFRRNDIDYEPREIDCRMHESVPPELVRLAPPPPPQYDGRPLMTVLRWPASGTENILMGKRYPVLLQLSEHADPESLEVTLNGERLVVPEEADSSPFRHIELPPRVGKFHVTVSVRARPEVVGAPTEPLRLEHRYELRGMQVMLEAKGVSVGPDGTATPAPTVKVTSEIDPETQEVIRTTREVVGEGEDTRIER